MGDHSNMPHPKMHKKLKKNPGIEQKTCEKGHSSYLQPERGHTRSLDYGFVSKMAQKGARRCHSPTDLTELNTLLEPCSILHLPSAERWALNLQTEPLWQRD